MRYILRLLALGAAFLLAWIGTGTSEEGTWRLFMAGILFFLLVAFWPGRKDPDENPIGRNVRLIGGIFLAIGLILGLQTLRLQILQADAIRTKTAELPEGAVENIRPVIVERRTRRGRIYDRDGILLADIQITEDDWVRRTYPRDDLGHIIGFYNPLYGNAGLEASYDDYLAGRVQVPPWEAFLEELLHQAHDGNDLRLTLDIELQEIAQEALGENRGAIVLLDTRTGAILAMASAPRFDPRPMVFDPAAADWERERDRITAYWKGLLSSPDTPLVDRAVAGLYPPGSTFKTLTAAIALETDVATPSTHIPCPNELVVTGHTIVNFMDDLAEQFMEEESLLEDYQYSCNTAFAQLGLMLGAERYSEHAKDFGLYYASLAPLQWPDFDEVPAATPTIARDRSFLDRQTGLADTAYGQGELQVTPLYLAMLAATIANDGMMMKPYLVEQAVTPDGEVLYQADPTPLRIPIGARTARRMRNMMTVAGVEGWGWRAQIEGVKVAGKTGTAETGAGVPHAVFIAFAPAENPQYAIAVLVENGETGARTSAPLAKIVLEAALGQE
jgi:peptidoglycan glycosyltransferase